MKSAFLKSLFCFVALFFSLQAKLQIITTVAGGAGGYSGDNGLTLNAGLGDAFDVDFDDVYSEFRVAVGRLCCDIHRYAKATQPQKPTTPRPVFDIALRVVEHCVSPAH